MKRHVAADQYGETVFLGRYPRKELLAHCDRQHAEKMYMDTPNGAEHVGWIIAGRWFHVWELKGFSLSAVKQRKGQ